MFNSHNVDVFISHHTSSSLHITQAICNSLESSGIRCWYAPRDTEGAYAGSIVSAINSCKVFVLVLNRESSVSQDVLNEINLAVERIRSGESLTILPFQISADVIGDDAKYYIGRLHWIDAVTPPLEERIRELKMRVMTVLHKEMPQTFSDGSISGTVRRSDQMPILKSTNLLPNGNFVCRRREMSQLRECLDRFNKIFIQGMGGIGKSELAKAYAIKNRDLYYTVIFATYQTNLRDLLIYDSSFQSADCPRTCDNEGKMETDESYFTRKLQWLQARTDEKTLIIIDNFDTLEDEHLESFLGGSYTVIFTTRNDFTELGLPVVRLTELNAESEQIELFMHYYHRPITPQHQQIIGQIMELVGGHTLAIEMIAKYMYHRRVLPEKMLCMLQKNGINAMAAGTVSHGFRTAQSGYANIQQLFNLYKLTEQERYIMQNLALTPLTGLDFTVFGDLCELEDFSVIDELIQKSWVRHDMSEDIISLHPLIREVVLKEYTPCLDQCAVFTRNLTKKLNQLWSLPRNDKVLYVNIACSVYDCFPNIDIAYMDLYLAICYGLMLLEQFEMEEKILNHCNEKCRSIGKEESVYSAQVYYRLSDNHLHRNDYSMAIQYAQQSINILERVAPNSEELAYMIKFLCWIRLGWSKDHETTEQFLHRSNQIFLSQNPVNQLQLASQNSAYAFVYYELGKYEQALNYAEAAYKTFVSVHGENHGDTLSPMTTKARILSKIGRGEEGVQLAFRVIEIQISLDGWNNQRVLNRYEFLAEIYVNIGEQQEAVKMLRKIVDVLEEKKDYTSPFYRRIVAKLEALAK